MKIEIYFKQTENKYLVTIPSGLLKGVYCFDMKGKTKKEILTMWKWQGLLIF